MDPYQEPSSAPSQYDFITNLGKPPKKRIFGSGSYKKRILLIIAGAVLLMILLSIVTTLLSSSSSTNERLRELAQEQQEVIRVAEIGTEQASNIQTRSLAFTVMLSVSSEQKELLAYLEKRGITFKKQEALALKEDPDTDKALETASDRNRFDEEFTEILNGQVAAYANNLETIYKSTKNETARALLNDSYTSASVILNPELSSE